LKAIAVSQELRIFAFKNNPPSVKGRHFSEIPQAIQRSRCGGIYPFNRESLVTSICVKSLLILYRKNPIITTLTNTSKNMAISTKKGIPPETVEASRNKPFSITNNPMTWASALILEIIKNKPAKTIKKAIASILVKVVLSEANKHTEKIQDKYVNSKAHSKDNCGLINNPKSSFALILFIIRYNKCGISETFKTNSRPAIIYKSGWRWLEATARVNANKQKDW